MPNHPNRFAQSEFRQNISPIVQGMSVPQNQIWGAHMNSYYSPIPGPMHGGNSSMQDYYFQQPQQLQNAPNNSFSQSLFQNPLNTQEDYYGNNQQTVPLNPYPYMHPYPKASFLMKQPQGMKSVLNSFKSQDGSLDINKMVDTAGQMMNAVTQVSSVVKGLSGMLKI